VFRSVCKAAKSCRAKAVVSSVLDRILEAGRSVKRKRRPDTRFEVRVEVYDAPYRVPCGLARPGSSAQYQYSACIMDKNTISFSKLCLLLAKI
jgi:hypothetical protein